jgi:hypothetical protein
MWNVIHKHYVGEVQNFSLLEHVVTTSLWRVKHYIIIVANKWIDKHLVILA